MVKLFQDTYELIQNNFEIKKVRKNKDLYALQKELMALIEKHGSDRNIDEHLAKNLDL